MRGTRIVVMALVVLAAVSPAGAVQASPDADDTVTRIDVASDGDARWTVVVRTRLRTDSDVRDYRAFQERFRENTSRYLDPFRDRIRGVVATAANETGRTMRARNFSASTSIQQVPRRWGVVKYTFAWQSFARTDGDAVAVGDVFSGGFYVARNDTLTVSGPPNYTLATADPEPTDSDDGTVRWVGPQNFADGHPSVRYVPGTPAAEGEHAAGDGPFGLLVGSVLSLFAFVGLAYGLYARRNGDGWGVFDDTSPRDPMVTDADRVERALKANGGRIKQAALAEELDWSASKTSRIVSEMDDRGRVEKLRIGRENVLSLPDESERND